MNLMRVSKDVRLLNDTAVTNLLAKFASICALTWWPKPTLGTLRSSSPKST